MLSTLMQIIISAVILGTGGTIFAATNAVPGDMLYPIKTQVTERIQEVLSFTEKSFEDLQLGLIEKRFKEAEQIQENFGLSQDQADMLLQNIERHEDKVRERIEVLRDKGNETAASALEQNLGQVREAHSNILQKIEEVVPGGKPEESKTENPSSSRSQRGTQKAFENSESVAQNVESTKAVELAPDNLPMMELEQQ